MARPIPIYEQAFKTWYADPRRSFQDTARKFGKSDRTIYNWRDRHGWLKRAEELDKEARALSDLAAVRRQAEMLQRQALQGRNLAATGANWFATHPNGIEEARDAISAIKIGQELERKAEGLPDWLIDLMGKTDDELRAEFNALADAETGGDQADS